ncbi:acyl-CoA dehydrogenase family protein, partial [Clavibacter michiganensis]
MQDTVSTERAATSAAKIDVQIASTDGIQLRQFVESGTDEEMLLDYQRHQRRLIQRIATTYAASFPHELLLVPFHSVFSAHTDTAHDRQALESLARALQPPRTYHALDPLPSAHQASVDPA